MTEADLEAYPYHCAVQFSGGDLKQFMELAKYIEQEGGDVNETLTIRNCDTSSKGEAVAASALMYASYLGHVDIVKWFLDRTDVVKTERSFLTIKRSLSSYKSSNEVWIKRQSCGA
ncbi:Ankyrin repeat-containing domain [Phytophthora cactorum]|nr:Ankyrin repeat-containing domain [Phytophthora cactorum]